MRLDYIRADGRGCIRYAVNLCGAAVVGEATEGNGDGNGFSAQVVRLERMPGCEFEPDYL